MTPRQRAVYALSYTIGVAVWLFLLAAAPLEGRPDLRWATARRRIRATATAHAHGDIINP